MKKVGPKADLLVFYFKPVFSNCPERNFRKLQSGRLNFFDDRGEGLGIAHSDVGQDFAIEHDVGRLEAVDEAAVGRAVQASSGIDARNPEFAQIALAHAAVAVSIPKAFEHGLIRTPEKAVAAAKIALVHFQDFLMTAVAGRATLYTSHELLLYEPLGAGVSHTCCEHPTAAQKNG